MKSIGVWLLLIVVMVVVTTETDAWRKRRKTVTKIKLKYKKIVKQRTSRSVENIVTLPCDVREFDIDKDRVISRLEWQAYMSELNPGLNTEYEDLIIHQLDTNGDGILQVEELSSDTEYRKDCLDTSINHEYTIN
ncbi:uncharacterized protein [Argopecten irradians]|uniref:uncharacterized protein isoform X2 n=1 Tax=Argopecten irradians TaxID=31199 RepID=UPI0037122B54